ncbi:MAG: hypothetical protein D6756_12330 [Cyanobacteria bacterium J083]|nr:MAG: hypothetical protein D6756_12330 [Cyanobacteria bacterium J083]
MTTVLFWDIDGTLIDSKGAGRMALEKAARSLTNKQQDLSQIPLAGMTDWSICLAILAKIGIAPHPDNIASLHKLYLQYLPSTLAATQGQAIAGVKEILQALTSRDDVFSLLLTGNSEAGAWQKLAFYGLDNFFSEGGFCQSTQDRKAIAFQALSVAEKKLGSIERNKCFILGDTPHDIACGKAIGAKTITLASPTYPPSILLAHDSWLVWQHYPQPATFLKSIGLIH